MPDTRLTSRARAAAPGPGPLSPSARTASSHPRDEAAARATSRRHSKPIWDQLLIVLVLREVIASGQPEGSAVAVAIGRAEQALG